MPRFSPPGNLTDLTTDAHLQEWSDVINGALNGRINSLAGQIGAANVQLVNPLTTPIANARPRRIPWFTFPQDVWDHRPRADARTFADHPDRRIPSPGQNEYSEWHTRRDDNGNVISVDVTTELPEYWDFLSTHLSHDAFVGIYRQYINSAVTEDDLFPGAGPYDPTNHWNKQDGAMHMINGINTLPDALGLIADATIWRFSGTEPVDVQLCDVPRTHHADPAVVAHFNRLAREERFITLADPVGIYIFDIDTMGWETPDGSDPRRLITFNRGNPPVRARVGVRRGCGCFPWRRPRPPRFKLSDVTICGEPIVSGSQIAERTTVGVIAMVGERGAIRPTIGQACTPVAFALAPSAAATGVVAPRDQSAGRRPQ
jgi:hypothetical protein